MVWWKQNLFPRLENGGDRIDTIAEIRKHRQNRFRILVCIDGSDESYHGVRYAKEIGYSTECDIILLNVRKIDQDLSSGGLQMRVARANMLEWDLELPGIQNLKRARDMLITEEELADKWRAIPSHRDIRGDRLGDNKIEYIHEDGKSIVLKLKTAADTVSGILDQYELGPYNLLIIGRPSRWRGEVRSLIRMSVVQKVAMLAPCSVLVAREHVGGNGFLVCCDGSDHSLNAVRRTAVLAHHCRKPLTLIGVASVEEERESVEIELDSAREMLDKNGIEKCRIISDVGDPVQQITEAGKDFELISVSDTRNSRLKLLFTHSIAFGVMGAAVASVLNVK